MRWCNVSKLVEMISMALRIYPSKSESIIKREICTNRIDWKRDLNTSARILVFDTETTGVDPVNDYMLSLSWQVLDGSLLKVDEQTRYFKNPLPESAVSDALKVNGLTNKVLEELGTTDKRPALEEFLSVVKSCDLVVGHNVDFDITVVSSECKREGLDSQFLGKLTFDTMRDTRDFCLYYHKPRMRKWPKLNELTQLLGIDTDDINWHKSSSDVEATARCLREIAVKGYAWSPWGKLIEY